MNRFMVGIIFLRFYDDPMIRPLLPAQQSRVKELENLNIIESFYISYDGSTGWIVMRGEEAEVRRAVESLPLYPHMEVGFTPLR